MMKVSSQMEDVIQSRLDNGIDARNGKIMVHGAIQKRINKPIMNIPIINQSVILSNNHRVSSHIFHNLLMRYNKK